MKKQYYTVIALTLLILGSAFYWSEYRPSSIRIKCNLLATKYYEDLLKQEGYYLNDEGGYEKNINGGYLVERLSKTVILTSELQGQYHKEADKEYTRCLHSRGLR